MGALGRWCSILFIVLIVHFPPHFNLHGASAKTLFRRSSEVACTICKPGFGVISKCNVTHDTLCARCSPGTFQSTPTLSSACRECTKCGEHFYIRTPCIPEQDATCSPCTGNAGFGNENFRKKCEKTTTTTSTTISTIATSTPTTSATTAVSSAFITEKIVKIPPEGLLLSQKFHANLFEPTEISSGAINVPGSGDSEQETSSPAPDPEFVEPTDEGFLPVKPRTRTKPPKRTKTEQPKVVDVGEEGETDTTEEPVVGAVQLDRGGFDFPIFITAVVCAIVFFILGMLVSTCVRRRNYNSSKKNETPYEADDSRTAMIQLTPLSKSPPDDPFDGDDARTPIYKDDECHSSTELPYIDEDSDDEIVRSLGRPPSINFKEGRRWFPFNLISTDKIEPPEKPPRSDTTRYSPNSDSNHELPSQNHI